VSYNEYDEEEARQEAWIDAMRIEESRQAQEEFRAERLQSYYIKILVLLLSLCTYWLSLVTSMLRSIPRLRLSSLRVLLRLA
jgi:hypothetical protein